MPFARFTSFPKTTFCSTSLCPCVRPSQDVEMKWLGSLKVYKLSTAPTKKGCGSSCDGLWRETIALCHDASSRLGGPVERVCMGVPFRDICHQALCQLIAVREVADLEPFALENTEPLLDLVHPGAMDG